jgi:hypothetical protein
MRFRFGICLNVEYILVEWQLLGKGGGGKIDFVIYHITRRGLKFIFLMPKKAFSSGDKYPFQSVNLQRRIFPFCHSFSMKIYSLRERIQKLEIFLPASGSL